MLLVGNPLHWPWWAQAALAALAVVEFFVIRHDLGPITKRGQRRNHARAAYELRRTDAKARRAEDLLWAIYRNEAYELAVEIALERAGGDLALDIARTLRTDRARKHLQVVA